MLTIELTIFLSILHRKWKRALDDECRKSRRGWAVVAPNLCEASTRSGPSGISFETPTLSAKPLKAKANEII